MLINIPFDYLNLLITRILLDFGSYLIIKPFWQATIFPLFLVGGNDPWIIPGHTIKCICFDPLTLIIKANVFGNGMGYFDTVMLTGRRVRNRGKQDSLFVVESDNRFDPAQLPQPERWDTRQYTPARISIYRESKSYDESDLD